MAQKRFEEFPERKEGKKSKDYIQRMPSDFSTRRLESKRQ